MKNLFIVALSLSLLFGCSLSKETVKEDEGGTEQIYVFDDVSSVPQDSVNDNDTIKKDTLLTEQPLSNLSEEHFIYFIQVGAFTSQERAERFKLINQEKIEYPLEISFSNQVNLWVVRLPKFDTKLEAEKVRDELWKIDTFKDAFIVTVQE